MNEKLYSAEEVRQILRYRLGMEMVVTYDDWKRKISTAEHLLKEMGELGRQYMNDEEAKRMYEDYYVRTMAEKCKATPATWIWWKKNGEGKKEGGK